MQEDFRAVGCALVVDDEDLIRWLAVDILADLGYTALEAGDGAAALHVLSAHPEILLLVTDINMPGEPDGLGLAVEARVLRPDLRVIVTSGRVLPLPGDMPPGSRFVAKPYTVSELIQAVGDA